MRSRLESSILRPTCRRTPLPAAEETRALLRRVLRSPRRYGYRCPRNEQVAPAQNGKLTLRLSQFIINATQPVNDRIFDASAFTTFLQQRIKVDGLTGNLGEKINVTNLGDGRIEVVAHQEFSGRYIKYLTKKFLKKQQLRDWLRVVATNKGEYTLKFFNVVGEEGEEEED
jgi:large subunit ribosomal protein L22e